MWSAAATAIIEEQIARLIAGQVNHATARADAMDALKRIGEWDFSEERYQQLDETIELNTSLRQLWRQYNDACDEVILDQWPAQELKSWAPDETEELKARWTSRGGRLFDGRMIALKNDPVWSAMSDFNLQYPPFAKGSNARVADVSRRHAMAFGLIDRDRQITLAKLPPPLGLK